MDWARAKTILITVFLIINLYLGYQVFSTRIGNTSYVDRDKVAEVISYLGSKEIRVESEIPYRKLEVPPLTVQYKLFKPEDIKSGLFQPGEAVETVAEGDLVRLTGAAKTVSIRNGMELQFENAAVGPKDGEMDEKQMQALVDAWLDTLGIAKKDRFEKSRASADGYLTLKYEQRYKGLAIYNSHLFFSANASGIREGAAVWFDSVKPVKQEIKIVSPTDVLLRTQLFVEENGMKPIKITGIEQGYYFSTGENTGLDVSKVVTGTAFPVWKVTTDRGIIYINGINLIIEGFTKAI